MFHGLQYLKKHEIDKLKHCAMTTRANVGLCAVRSKWIKKCTYCCIHSAHTNSQWTKTWFDLIVKLDKFFLWTLWQGTGLDCKRPPKVTIDALFQRMNTQYHHWESELLPLQENRPSSTKHGIWIGERAKKKRQRCVAKDIIKTIIFKTANIKKGKHHSRLLTITTTTTTTKKVLSAHDNGDEFEHSVNTILAESAREHTSEQTARRSVSDGGRPICLWLTGWLISFRWVGLEIGARVLWADKSHQPHTFVDEYRRVGREGSSTERQWRGVRWRAILQFCFCGSFLLLLRWMGDVEIRDHVFMLGSEPLKQEWFRWCNL